MPTFTEKSKETYQLLETIWQEDQGIIHHDLNFPTIATAEKMLADPNLGSGELDGLARFLTTLEINDNLAADVAGRLHTAPDTLLVIAKEFKREVHRDHGEFAALSAVAGNSHTPAEYLGSLTQQILNTNLGEVDGDYRPVLTALSLNPTTPPESLNQIAEISDMHFVGAMLKNPSVPAEVHARFEAQVAEIHEWAKSPRKKTRERAARNYFTMPEILTQLSHDPDSDVRGAVADNPHTDPTTIARLAHDPDSGVRFAAALNPHMEDTILSEKIIVDTLPDLDTKGRCSVAAHTTHPSILDQLAHDKSSSVRCDVAQNIHTTAKTRLTLFQGDFFDPERARVQETVQALVFDWMQAGDTRTNSGKATPSYIAERALRDSSPADVVALLSNPDGAHLSASEVATTVYIALNLHPSEVAQALSEGLELDGPAIAKALESGLNLSPSLAQSAAESVSRDTDHER